MVRISDEMPANFFSELNGPIRAINSIPYRFREAGRAFVGGRKRRVRVGGRHRDMPIVRHHVHTLKAPRPLSIVRQAIAAHNRALVGGRRPKRRISHRRVGGSKLLMPYPVAIVPRMHHGIYPRIGGARHAVRRVPTVRVRISGGRRHVSHVSHRMRGGDIGSDIFDAFNAVRGLTGLGRRRVHRIGGAKHLYRHVRHVRRARRVMRGGDIGSDLRSGFEDFGNQLKNTAVNAYHAAAANPTLRAINNGLKQTKAVSLGLKALGGIAGAAAPFAGEFTAPLAISAPALGALGSLAANVGYGRRRVGGARRHGALRGIKNLLHRVGLGKRRRVSHRRVGGARKMANGHISFGKKAKEGLILNNQYGQYLGGARHLRKSRSTANAITGYRTLTVKPYTGMGGSRVNAGSYPAGRLQPGILAFHGSMAGGRRHVRARKPSHKVF